MMEKLKDKDVSNIEFKIYANDRHEPFTGLNRKEAFSDVEEWTCEVVEGVIEARRQSYAMPDFARNGD